MATTPLSFVMGSFCLSCRTTQSFKLNATAPCSFGKIQAHNLQRINVERNLLHGEVAKNVTKSYCQDRRFEVLAVSRFSVAQTAKIVSTYLLRTENDGHVKVLVSNERDGYRVMIEASNLHLSGNDELIMSWRIFRSDSSSFMPIEFRRTGSDGKSSTVESSFVQKSFDGFTVGLDFESSLAPFYVSFVLKSKNLEIRSHRKTSFCFPVGIRSGYPAPLGISYSDNGSMNFAFFSREAERVVLCLFDDDMNDRPSLEIDLDPYVNRSGDIWHASMDTISTSFTSYGYRCIIGTREKRDKFHVVLDPYAKRIAANGFGQLSKEPAFDWAGDTQPFLPMEELRVYRLNVKRFTIDKSSKLSIEISGTFSGIIQKLDHFKNLGVNALLLEPIFPFDKQEGPYVPCHFFSPMNIYGPSGRSMSAILSMKEMVKNLHANGMEVFLEVVFTHTSKGGVLIAIDEPSYVLSEEDGDVAGRHGLNCNHPIAQQMILDSLRHWVIEFHVDGFCFVNASSMLRGSHGKILSRPPLIEAVAFDPILSKTKIIADCFDPHTKASRGETAFPHWKRWAEMSSKFCIDIRNYLRGEGLLSNLATRLCGSGDIFLNGRGPAFSFNFIARNPGLPLVDLVSFSRSELASELSWNCGEEGPTSKTEVLERRLKQIRNFLFILFVSLGVPVLNMGDECGQSSGGSIEYKDRKPFNWNALGTGFAIQTTEFISFMSSLRTRRSDLLQKSNFLKEENIEWHGSDLSPPNWEDPIGKFLAMTLKAEEEEEESQSSADAARPRGDLFVAFNAADQPKSVTLPAPPAEMAWFRLVDTACPYPGFFCMDGDPVLEQMPGLFAYQMASHSCILFEAKSLKMANTDNPNSNIVVINIPLSSSFDSYVLSSDAKSDTISINGQLGCNGIEPTLKPSPLILDKPTGNLCGMEHGSKLIASGAPIVAGTIKLAWESFSC